MLKRFFFGLIFFTSFSILLTGADKSKKTYELIYKDIQILKQQIQNLDKKIDSNREEISSIHKQLTEILKLNLLARSEQAGLFIEQKKIPAQYQVLLQKFDTISYELAKITEKLIEIEQTASPPEETLEDTESEKPLGKEKSGGEEISTEIEEQPIATSPPNLSPQQVFNMARSDYLKGNFQLAIEGFAIYREHFAESPLADNALYWIGESFFSQNKFEEAIRKFNDFILIYPNGDKIAAAYLKKGISLMNLKKKDEAISVFRLLISKFPLEEETKIAQQKIKELE